TNWAVRRCRVSGSSPAYARNSASPCRSPDCHASTRRVRWQATSTKRNPTSRLLDMEQIINRVANGRPSAAKSIAIYGPGGRNVLSLSELDRLARKTAVHLQRLGISAGDRIGIVAKNRLEWLLLDLAALKLKAVTAAFEAGKFPATPALAERYALRIVFSDEASGASCILPMDNLLATLEALPEDLDLAPVAYAPGDVTTIKFTSGSTGEPKGLAATVGSID